MRTLDPDALAALQAGRVNQRGLLVFSLGSGDYGFWTGLGETSIGGQTYVGAGSLITAEAIGEASDLSAASLTITLTAAPNSDLSPDVLATIESEDYHLRPVTMSQAFFNADTNAFISAERIYRGYIDQVEHALNAKGQAQLLVHCVSKALDNAKTGYRYYSDADQRRIDATDRFLRHSAVAGDLTIYWGRKPAKHPKRSA